MLFLTTFPFLGKGVEQNINFRDFVREVAPKLRKFKFWSISAVERKTGHLYCIWEWCDSNRLYERFEPAYCICCPYERKVEAHELFDVYMTDDYELLGEAYLSLDYNQIDYFSDTGRTWHPTMYNIKDKTTIASRYHLEITDDLIRHIHSGRSNHICILTHPERWPSHPVHWILQSALDLSIKLIKGFYSFTQRPKP